MESYVGEWVILKDDVIIEHNKDVKVILKSAEKYNDDEITISKVPSTNFSFFHKNLFITGIPYNI